MRQMLEMIRQSDLYRDREALRMLLLLHPKDPQATAAELQSRIDMLERGPEDFQDSLARLAEAMGQPKKARDIRRRKRFVGLMREFGDLPTAEG